MKNKAKNQREENKEVKRLVVLSGVSGVNEAKQDELKSRCKMNETEIDLEHFTGTEDYYKHSFGGIMVTDGVQYLAYNAKAFWLIDAIASHQTKRISPIPFQLWELMVNPDKTAVLTMKEDKDCPILVKQNIPYTDYPMPKIKLWLSNRVLMLPTEY